MAYYDGDFDQFLEDRLKRCKTARFSNAGARHQAKAGKNRSFKFNRKLVWLAVSYLVVIGLLFGSFGTAYAAKDSLPNEPLYAVKLAGEDLQLLLTSDINARISLLTTFANRRVDEATILAAQGQPIPEQVSALVDEYQEEIVALSVSLEEVYLEEDSGSDRMYQRPQDRDNEEQQPGGNTTLEEPWRWENSQPEDQTTVTLDLEIPDPSVSVTGTIGITGTMHMTQTRSGQSNSSGQENRQEYSPGPEYGSGPEYGPSDIVPSPEYGPGPCYGPGNSCTVPQQPPDTNPQIGSGSSNQPTENKGKKP